MLLAGALGGRTAAAQTIAVANETSLPRYDASGNQVAKRASTLSPEAVNYQDCLDDQRIRLVLTLTGIEANAALQVWATNNGQDCSVATARAGGVQTCWKAVAADVALATTTQVDVPVRSLMSGAYPKTAADLDATEAICGQVDLTNLSLQILYFAPGNLATAAVDHTIAVTVDTVGPAAPTGLAVLPGNHRLEVTWTSISGGDADAGTTGGLTALTGVNAYCDLAKTVTTIADASCAADAAADARCEAGASSTNSCVSDALSTTTSPDSAFGATYLCGSVSGNTGTGVYASSLGGKELQNGVSYAVAVAATDAYGNVGPLSDVLCVIPEETTDFWENYRAEGGQAGCATGPGDAPVGTLGALVGLGALTVVRRRRR